MCLCVSTECPSDHHRKLAYRETESRQREAIVHLEGHAGCLNKNLGAWQTSGITSTADNHEEEVERSSRREEASFGAVTVVIYIHPHLLRSLTHRKQTQVHLQRGAGPEEGWERHPALPGFQPPPWLSHRAEDGEPGDSPACTCSVRPASPTGKPKRLAGIRVIPMVRYQYCFPIPPAARGG